MDKLISEKKVLDVINEAIRTGRFYYGKERTIEEIKAIPSAEPCEDAISREWLKTAIHNFYYGLKHIPTEEDIQAYIDVAPSVNPQEPTRHWEWVQYDSNPNIGNWHCSECRTIIPHMPEETDNTPIYKWCPICGARMIEPQESEEV